MILADFITKYPPKAPKVRPANQDESRLLAASDGVLHIVTAPFPNTRRAHPNGSDADVGRHLWVFVGDNSKPALPAIVELTPIVPPLETGKVKHTNLTGGGPASCGGELWVDPVTAGLYVSGASGRFGPDDPAQLADAVSVFVELGYAVRSFGWDNENDRPARFLRDT